MPDHSQPGSTIAPDLIATDLFWRAANYLAIGQIYLLTNPLLRETLTPAHIKPRLLGHWGTTPGLTFIWAHLNRVIRAHDLDVLYVAGPGHGGPGLVAAAWLEGGWTARWPDLKQDAAGMAHLCRQFSFPGGIPSHAAPVVPGSLHEGGELGYSLVHAQGAVMDNPGLIAACVIGDGEAETGPLATSWHGQKWLNPARDGAVLPILHLNGWKIANPTLLSRMPEAQLVMLLRGYGYEPVVVSGHDPAVMHLAMAAALDTVLDRIAALQADARATGGVPTAWPMIVLRTPKGWTGPAMVDGLPVEGTWRAHQVPLAHVRDNPAHLALLEQWLRSYRPAELFDDIGAPVAAIREACPDGNRRMSLQPASLGLPARPLVFPPFRAHALKLPAPGAVSGEATRTMGAYIAAIMQDNPDRFRVFGPDETASNRLDATLAFGRMTLTPGPLDDHPSTTGRVLEVLSEHLCEGWLEGYTLTGRHGLFNCYEAFIHIVDSMVNQHIKWLREASRVPWRPALPSLTILLTSHVWRQDHNGFSHQDPGFLDHVATKGAEQVRIYLPPDANCLLSVTDHCLRSTGYLNVIVAGKQPEPQWLPIEDAVQHCTAGAGNWPWASDPAPDIVLACAGDVPTIETLAATMLLRDAGVRVRVVNVVDLMCISTPSLYTHGLLPDSFARLFTLTTPVIFAFHGYPQLVHALLHGRPEPERFHVHGFRNEGTTTTPFDMCVLNGIDRFTLALDALYRLDRDTDPLAARLHAWLGEHRAYVREHGEDLPIVRNWAWA